MSLNAAQRSKSAPHHLTSFASSSKSREQEEQTRESPLVTPGVDAQDPFNLEGTFFPRANSYFSFSSLNIKPNPNWTYSQHYENSRASSPTSSAPMSPIAHRLGILSPVADEDAEVDADIESEDHVASLVSMASRTATMIAAPAYGGPSYDHDHLFHSYDTLHSSFHSKRKLATDPIKVGSMKMATSTGEVSCLFSPVEEELEPGVESWVADVYENLWVRR